MKKRSLSSFVILLLMCLVWLLPAEESKGWTVVGWNTLGMHCMDNDFSIFSLLPPYTTIYGQVIDQSGKLVISSSGITLTYQAIADSNGSINTTSQGKTNFWQYVLPLYGASPLPDMGLAGYAMPGTANLPQMMTFSSTTAEFNAEGIPLTPYDDQLNKNTYPMMRLVAKDGSGTSLATLDIVLPVSDEMDCKACHTSGSSGAAKPSPDWVWNPDPVLDVRLNIILLHDNRQATNFYATVTSDGIPILCASCHASNALPGTGIPGIPALTSSIHSKHATVIDPTNGLILDSSSNRSACYRCHPGSATKCLRGVMGRAVAPDGSLEIQCQSCHGSMSAVGSPSRQGWLNEPNCQSCHTGTAVSNNGQIRYTSVFESSGQVRQAVNQTYATNPNTPSTGYSLYRYSTGHGGLQCEACHGSTHAEFPSFETNDNVQSLQLQGHVGMLVECSKCHGVQPVTVNGGPHGMHPVGQSWVNSHGESGGESGRDGVSTALCQACHGGDSRGTVLSRSQADRTLYTDFGVKHFWRGFQISCYACHNGPGSESPSPNHPPVASSTSASTSAGVPVTINLSATDQDGNQLTLRIVSQPAHGTTGLNYTQATYYPDTDFTGSDSFTFAAWDGYTNSNLGTVTITVTGGGTGCTTWNDVVAKYNAYASGQAVWTDVMNCYSQYTAAHP